jgi:hypothetical protein
VTSDTASTPFDPLEFEIRFLALDYAHLRVRDAAAEAALCASIERHGLLDPLMAVARDDGTRVLVDGYRRVRVLARLGINTARTLVVSAEEPEALAWMHRLARANRRTALEEGWLVRELARAGWTLDRIGDTLGRCKSWVSRRLGLADGLSDVIAETIRRGTLCAHGVMRSVLPLARANANDAERIVAALSLASVRVTSRQLETLWLAYKRGDAELRERIAATPLLFLRAHTQTAATPPETSVLASLRRAEHALGQAHTVMLASQSHEAPLGGPRIGRRA